jgi:predicted peptidase
MRYYLIPSLLIICNFLCLRTHSANLESTNLEPGKQLVISAKNSGELGYYKLFLPQKYNAESSWPIIYCYHGLNGKPTLFPFSQLLKGESFIIVGMGYQKRGIRGYSHLKAKDTEILRGIHKALKSRLKINDKKIFVGGFSKGAFYASGFINHLPSFFAGAMIYGGGKNNWATDKKAFINKPIFISAGDKCPNFRQVTPTKEYYLELKAKVTSEIMPNTGHSINFKTTKGKEWLLKQLAK